MKLILVPATTAQQLEALARGQVDVGLVVPMPRESRGMRVRPSREQALVLAVPGSHALPGQPRVQLRDLANETFVGFARMRYTLGLGWSPNKQNAALDAFIALAERSRRA